ncbi:hypothetical protein BJ546DRAFT_652048 [Cryomyces antarcticus]
MPVFSLHFLGLPLGFLAMSSALPSLLQGAHATRYPLPLLFAACCCCCCCSMEVAACASRQCRHDRHLRYQPQQDYKGRVVCGCSVGRRERGS